MYVRGGELVEKGQRHDELVRSARAVELCAHFDSVAADAPFSPILRLARVAVAEHLYAVLHRVAQIRAPLSTRPPREGRRIALREDEARLDAPVPPFAQGEVTLRESDAVRLCPTRRENRDGERRRHDAAT